MSGEVVRQDQASTLEKVLIEGDLGKLTPEQRLEYYQMVCKSLGVNPLTKPFSYITLNNRLVLYANRDAAEQLRKLNGVSITGLEHELMGDLYIVTSQAKDNDGRTDTSTGVVNLAGLKGDNLANALMKAETKAKRRVTLSICGLGWLDETEVESIPDAKPAELPEEKHDAKPVDFPISGGPSAQRAEELPKPQDTPRPGLLSLLPCWGSSYPALVTSASRSAQTPGGLSTPCRMACPIRSHGRRE